MAVIRNEDFQMPYTTRPPLVAVEVVSPESVFRDHHIKRRAYAEFGIPSYWVITPDPDKASIIELRLEDGAYTEVSAAFGDEVFETRAPFPVRIVPHWLAAPGDWRARIGGAEEAATQD